MDILCVYYGTSFVRDTEDEGTVHFKKLVTRIAFDIITNDMNWLRNKKKVVHILLVKHID